MKLLIVFLVVTYAGLSLSRPGQEQCFPEWSSSLLHALKQGVPQHNHVSGYRVAPGPPCSNDMDEHYVDLPYEKHVACRYNATTRTYHFTNIRFGQDTSFQNRWKKPLEPEIPPEIETNNGSQDRYCPGIWLFCKDATEDCLFLDVVVPESVWNSRHHGGSPAPIIFAVFGGGFRGGTKTDPDPDELMLHAEQESALDQFIWVTANYRVGNLGWLGADEIVNDGVPNAGLHDIELALQWVRKYISKFNGDPEKVTLYGWSSGAGVIAHMLTAYGGDAENQVPFHRAVMHSPGWTPTPDNITRQNHYERFKKYLRAENLEDLRNIPYDTICAASNSDRNLIGIGPVVAGEFVPDSLPTLFAHGRFKKNVQVMTGHGALEGLQFAMAIMDRTPRIEYDDWISETFPAVDEDVKRYMTEELYPYYDVSALPPEEIAECNERWVDFTNSLARLGALVPSKETCEKHPGGCAQYWKDLDRFSYAVAEGSFTCNTAFIQQAYRGYSWLFAAPGFHSQDFYYVLYKAAHKPEVLNDWYPLVLKDYVLTFAQTGEPKSLRPVFVPKFQNTGEDRRAQKFDINGFAIYGIHDDTDSENCKWWEQVAYKAPTSTLNPTSTPNSKQGNIDLR